MNEREFAEQFSKEVDQLINPTDREPAAAFSSAEYQETLALAKQMANTDWSEESNIKETLRARLIDNTLWEKWLPQSTIQEKIMRTLFKNRMRMVTVAIVAVIFGTVLLFPKTVSAISSFFYELVVGEHTTIQQVSPDENGLPVSHGQEIDVTTTSPDITQPGGPNSAEPFQVEINVDEYKTFEEAKQAATGINLRQPTYLPEGYQFKEAKVVLKMTAAITYSGPNGDITLNQTKVGGNSELSASASFKTAHKPVAVQVNGTKAGWIAEDGILVWEANSVSYTLYGKNFTKEQIIRIAESLR